MTEPDNSYEKLLALWSIQESLLQTYRSIFISAQSIVAGFAVAIVTTHKYLAVILLIVLGVFFLRLWVAVCRSRALDVTFIQWRILKAEEGEPTPKPLSALKEFQSSKTFQGKPVLQEERFENDAKSLTRHRMDRQLPFAFEIIWFLLTVYVLADILFGL